MEQEQNRSTRLNHQASRSVALGVASLATFVGGGSLLLFAWFLCTGSLNLVKLPLDETTALAFDACLCLAFFVQHSIMVRKSYRQWSSRFIPSHYQDASYAVISGILLLALVIFWQESAYMVAAPQGALRWLIRGLYFLAIAGFLWGSWALRSFDALGRKPIRDYLLDRKPLSQRFIIRGPYRWVRHPLYSFTLLMIWSCPDLTADRLLFNFLFTAWIVLATILEERDLIVTFGHQYREYQQNVPMLIPHRRPRAH
jgi:protein-S-isoprenylcysteine O-methyltransferase Ste14